MAHEIQDLDWENRTLEANRQFSKKRYARAKRAYEEILNDLDRRKPSIGKVCDHCKLRLVDWYWITCQNLADSCKKLGRRDSLSHYYLKPLQFIGEIMNHHDVYVSTYQELQKRYNHCLSYYMDYYRDCDPELGTKLVKEVIDNTKPSIVFRTPSHETC